MSIEHITYGSPNMSISAEKCCQSALEFGCHNSINLFGSESNDFKTFNNNIYNHIRGSGYWLWKPYIIYRTLFECYADDIVIYTDAGLLFENSVKHLISAMSGDVMVFDNRWKHGDWCKMDVLEAMGCNHPDFINHTQLQASCIILKNTGFARNFIKEWLCWCMMPGFIDDSPSKLPNIEGFREHRHDQAILTNLAFKYKLQFHWWPVQYCLRYKHQYTDNYPQIFLHHRKRNNEW